MNKGLDDVMLISVFMGHVIVLVNKILTLLKTYFKLADDKWLFPSLYFKAIFICPCFQNSSQKWILHSNTEYIVKILKSANLKLAETEFFPVSVK